MKSTLLVLRRHGLTDLMGLVIEYLGEHPDSGQNGFMDHVASETGRPMDPAQVSSLFKTLEQRGYLRFKLNKEGARNKPGTPKKLYTLEAQGRIVFQQFPNHDKTGPEESPVAH